MATKKCPKCGEENPAEAVMCWACYTPLAGGAAAAAGGGLVTPRGGAAAVTPAATAAQEDEKKALDPKIFLVAGLLVGALIIGGFTTGIFGSSNSSTLPMPDLPEGPIVPGGPGVSQPGPVPPPITNFGSGGGGGGGTTGPAPVGTRFKTVVPPNPRYANGTMGIIATPANISPAQASGLAKYAQQMFAPNGRWKAMQVVVFSDDAAAKTFQRYQARRMGAKLTPKEYQELAQMGIWSKVPAYYEKQGNSEGSYQPSASPNSWWTGRASR